MTDFRLPALDGLTVLREATAIRPDTPVVLMSGHASMDLLHQALLGGAFDFLPKPINPHEFPRIVGWALDLHRLRRDVKAHHLIIMRLSRQVAALEEQIEAVKQRGLPPIPQAASLIIASRGLHERSLDSMQETLKPTAPPGWHVLARP